MTQSAEASAHPDLALSAFLEAFATGRRVLWIGDPSTGAPERMAAFCHSVLVLDTSGRGRRRRGGSARVALYRPGELELEAGSFDLAVVPDLRLLENPSARVAELSSALGDGMLLAGVRAEPDPDAAYRLLEDPLADAFREVRMFGMATFGGFALADLDAETHETVLVDTSLLSTGQEIERYFALAADELPGVEVYTVVQVGESPEEGEEEVSDDSEARTREVAALRDELERSMSRLEHLQARLMTTERELAQARADLRERGDDSDANDEVHRLESLLSERSREVRELESELARRELVVRDVVEELREHQLGRRGAGAERTIDAQAAQTEALFTVDELRAELVQRDDKIRDLESARAQCEGRARGLRSRVAELDELWEIASARARVFETDMVTLREEHRKTQGELAEAREAIELSMIRARGAPGRMDDATALRLAELEMSERRLSERVGQLSGQLVAARDLLAQADTERDRARGEVMRLMAQVTALETRMEGARIGYEMRIAMMLDDQVRKPATEHPPRDSGGLHGELDRVHDELARLRGERDGLRLRLADAEASTHTRGSDELAARLAEVEAARQQAQGQAEDRARALGTRDALVTRLQHDLSQSEDSIRQQEVTNRQLEEENERLRAALLGASTAVDEKEAAQQREAELKAALASAEGRLARAEADVEAAASDTERVEALEAQVAGLQKTLDAADKRAAAADEDRERIQSLEEELATTRAQLDTKQEGGSQSLDALRELRSLLDDARAQVERAPEQARSDITAAGDLSAPPTEGQRLSKLEQEVHDKDTLLRSLTAQLEERSDRIRALERRIAGEGAPGVSSSDLQQEMLELQERASRLQEELDHERSARSDAEERLGQLERRPEAEAEIDRLEGRLRRQESELQAAMSRATSYERDIASLRTVFAEARDGLEELLGEATSSGDPATAERIGALLSVLGRF